MAGLINTCRKDSAPYRPTDCETDRCHPCDEGELTGRVFSRNDLARIVALMLFSVILGIFMISTTVMTSEDGTFYIDRARHFAQDPIAAMKAHPPGFPFMILMAHKFAALFGAAPSISVWVYSAQSVTLLCRALAIIPLYLMGNMLVGRKNTVWAIFILLFLPYPAKSVCDAVREWPYLLFLATGLFFLFWGARCRKSWVIGLVGLSAGLGYLIRPASALLIVCALLWLGICMLRPRLWNVPRKNILLACALLLLGFAIPVVPYIQCTGEIAPPHAKEIIELLYPNASMGTTGQLPAAPLASGPHAAALVNGDILNALGTIFAKLAGNLMWFFLPALVIGLYYRLRCCAWWAELLPMTLFILGSVAMLVVRYCYVEAVISKRWTLPLVTFTIFYVPVGMHVIGNGFARGVLAGKSPDKKKALSRSVFVVMLVIGIALCVPKLLRPLRIEKQGYRDAALWLKENTAPTDAVASPDRRLAFYAERESLNCTARTVPEEAKYVVLIVASEDKGQAPSFGRETEEAYSVWADTRSEGGRSVVIYRVIQE